MNYEKQLKYKWTCPECGNVAEVRFMFVTEDTTIISSHLEVSVSIHPDQILHPCKHQYSEWYELVKSVKTQHIVGPVLPSTVVCRAHEDIEVGAAVTVITDRGHVISCETDDPAKIGTALSSAKAGETIYVSIPKTYVEVSDEMEGGGEEV